MAKFTSATANTLTSTLNAKRYLSDGYNPTYERRAFMGTVASQKFGDPDWIDPLDPKLLVLLKGKIPYEEIYYTNQPITNIANKYYGNTTLWWLIVMFNGYLQAADIPDGAKLKVPSLQFIQQKLDTNKNNNRGKITRF